MNPLPSPPVLTPPVGWLGFLGIKSGGKQPEMVAPGLACILDMLPFYMGSSVLIAQSGPIAAVYNGGTLLFTVPVGKAWIVRQVVLQAGVAGAVAAVRHQITMNDSGGFVRYATPTVAPVYGTGEIALLSTQFERPQIASAGERIQAFMTAVAAPTAFNYNANVYGLEVSA